MFRLRTNTLAIATTLLAMLCSPALADIAWNNMPEDQWISLAERRILGASGLFGPRTGDQFTSRADGMIDTIELPVSLATQATVALMRLELFSDASGQPGSVLATWQGIPVPPMGQEIVTVQNHDPSASLSIGQKYWLMASGPDGAAYWWHLNAGPPSVGVGRTAIGSGTLGPWTINEVGIQGAYRISTVPEPGLAAVCEIAGLACLGRRRGHKRDTRRS